jgi:hypothetical protein
MRWRAVALTALAFIATGCREAAAPVAAAERHENIVVWRPLGQWSGRGSRQTGSFGVETGALRLRWTTSNERAPGEGRFRVSLNSAISGRVLQTLVDAHGVASDVSFVTDDPRMSYLVIDSDGVDWTAALEEAGPAAAPSTRPGS